MATSANDKPRNVLLMVADDLGRDYLACYGNRTIKTPNIDRLAASGTRFASAFASTASCSGSRSTIYTGLHTHQNGQYGLEHDWNHFMTHEHIETVPKVFNGLGFLTGIIGKVHVGPRRAYPWEVFESSQSRNVKWVAERAAAFFDRASDEDKQFHLTIGWTDPHRDETRGGFANDFPEVINAGLDEEVPDYGLNEVEVQRFMTDVPELRTELVQYYKSISRMDLGVGLVMEALRERGLEESTLVVFVSDNGAPFINSKTTMYDAGVQLPLIIREPGQHSGIVNPNMASFLDILPTSLAWTIGTQDPPIINDEPIDTKKSPTRLGNSLLPILGDTDLIPVSEWKHHVTGSHTFHEVQNYWPTRYIRTHRYKYHRNIAYRLDFPFAADLYGSLSWEGVRNQDGPQPVVIGKRPLEQYLFRGPEELYDLERDPDEVTSVVHQQEYGEVLQWCRQMVEAWQYETADPWLFKDGVSATVMEIYVKQGLKLPDRYELDPRNPGTKHAKAWEPPTRPESLEPPAITPQPAKTPQTTQALGTLQTVGMRATTTAPAKAWSNFVSWWQDS
ncbi:hypothetical protein LTR86_005010 [Recurvomyces mirabilis]|nr:hypothetical protein LTR86_005010 [Recurvomyces mirabilis]